MKKKWPSLKIGDTAWSYDDKTARLNKLSCLGQVRRIHWDEGVVTVSNTRCKIDRCLFGPCTIEAELLMSIMVAEHSSFKDLPAHFREPGRLVLLHVPWKPEHHVAVDRVGGNVLVFRSFREEEMVPMIGPGPKVIDWAIMERKNQGVWSTTVPLSRFLEKPEVK